MPIYEYRCSECGFQDEFLQKLSDPLMTLCPSCGKEGLKKLLSAAGFQLKGSGWYATDFKGSGSKPAAKSETAAEGKDATAKTTGDSKPADSGAATTKPAPVGTSG
jgi:putative FmdB family regulatory protein